MKTIQLILLSVFLFGVHTIAQSQTIESEYYDGPVASSSVPGKIVDIVVHDVTLPEFVYDKTLSLSSHEHIANFNLPFAHHFNISGGHISFTVDKEDFDYYFYRNHKKDGYYDLKFDINYSATGPDFGHSMDVSSYLAIIRIVFK